MNPIFEGNQQHDAHELLVCLLDNIRETCCQLRQAASVSAVTTAPPPPLPPVKQSWSRQVNYHTGLCIFLVRFFLMSKTIL